MVASDPQAPVLEEPPVATDPGTPPAEPAQTVEPAPATQRDEQGRFAKRDPAEPGQAEPPPDQPAPSKPDEVAAGEPSTEVPPAETPGPVASYRADGRSVEIDGSEVGSDGVFISSQSWPRVQQLLSAAAGYPRLVSERDLAIRDVQQKLEASQAARQHLSAKLTELSKADPETVKDWLADLQRNMPVWLAEAKAEESTKLLQAREARLQQYEEAQQEERLRPQLEQGLEDILTQYCQQEPFKGVDGARVYKRLARQMDRVFLLAEDDDGQGRWRKGEIVVDYGAIEQELRDEVDVAKRYRGNGPLPPQAKKPTPPPTLTTKAGPVPGKAVKQPTFTTGQEAWDWVDRGGHLTE